MWTGHALRKEDFFTDDPTEKRLLGRQRLRRENR